MPDQFAQFHAAREISALMGRVTPGPARIPVPGRALQFGILTIGDRSPTGGERFLEDFRSVDFVDDTLREDVDRRSQRDIRIECLERVGRVYVDGCDRLL